MTNSKVFVTGVTGLVGFQILVKALEAGYTACAVLRNAAKQSKLAEHPLLSPHHSKGTLSFTVIPDFSDAGAWKSALQDATHVIHAASAVAYPHLDPTREIYEPNVRALDALLAAAQDSTTLQRIVLTSSIVGIMPLPPRSPARYNADSSVAGPIPIGGFTDVDDAYQASKIYCLNKARELRGKSHFDIINIHPGYVLGADQQAVTAKDMFTSSNFILLAVLTGMNFPITRLAVGASLGDVAGVHVKALDPSIPGNKDYGVGVPMNWNRTVDIARERFPEAFESGVLKAGSMETEEMELDTTETEKVFGLTHVSFEDMVIETVGHYLELLEKEQHTE